MPSRSAAAWVSSSWIRPASSSATSARRLRSTSGRTRTATVRPCRVIVISSPPSTRDRSSGRVARPNLILVPLHLPIPVLTGAALLTFARIVTAGAAMDAELQATI